MLSKSPPFFHALTGCEYTPSFSRKGKVRPFKILEKDELAQETFSQFGCSEHISQEQFKLVEKFVCKLYGNSKCSSVSELRLETFLQKYKPKKSENPISCVKKMDSSFLPPCSAVIREKVKRCHYITSMWLSSVSAHPPSLSPDNYGWIYNVAGQYEVSWFDCDMSPPSLHLTIKEDHGQYIGTADEGIIDS